ncbi:hypothetical protein GBAR_LOCUS30109 [Geodia barretti]|uniref:Uncharacterized protein n=1 Tax=Geodia barretti TaxID=519541 RepID=A0AA35XKD5_GEOBA|nr:hypothetical protein GBAR_LOCUS30109 [Geodia barretti]
MNMGYELRTMKMLTSRFRDSKLRRTDRKFCLLQLNRLLLTKGMKVSGLLIVPLLLPLTL